MEVVDSLGNPHTVNNPASIEAINFCLHTEANYMDPNMEVLTQALSEDPTCPTLLTIKAYFILNNQKEGFLDKAKQVLSQINQGNERETAWKQGMQTLVSQGADSALPAFLNIVQRWPTDLLAYKMGVTLCFYTGENAKMLEFAQAVLGLAEHQTSAEYLSITAFAYQENNLLKEAQAYAETALKLNPQNAWAQHNLCHVHSMREDFQQAYQVLANKDSDWENSHFLSSHNTWHVIVCLLMLGRSEEAQAKFQQLLELNWWHNLHKLDILGSLVYFDINNTEYSQFMNDEQRHKLINQKFQINVMSDVLSVWYLAKQRGQSPCEELQKVNEEVRQVAESMVLQALGRHQEAVQTLQGTIDKLPRVGASIEQRKIITNYVLSQ